MSIPVSTAPIAVPGTPSGRAWRVRDYRPDHLEGVVHIGREWSGDAPHPVYTLAEIVAACESGVGVVVTEGSRVIGAAVARVELDRAWILLLAQDPAHRDQGLGSALLAGLESRLAQQGIFRISALLPGHESRLKALRNSEYVEGTELRYFERRVPVHRADLRPLNELGGTLLPRGLWQALAGMADEKRLIESRLIAPLSNPELAEQYGVRPPRAVVLFGPPGTGKTTFARAIASRLGWPFVELHPSRMTGDDAGLAGALRSRFLEIGELEHAVVFIDEVEEIATRRDLDRPSVAQAATNELLKSIPPFRQREGRLLICATNFIRNLDSAFLRHGRFDYVIPIGLPDAAAREAIWRRYLPGGTDVDVDQLAAASAGFSPADIEFAARRAAQRAFDAAIAAQAHAHTGRVGTRTESYLEAIADTRPTVSETTLSEFNADISALART